jgi:hypothetical protein
MRKETTYGGLIHSDGTIARITILRCENKEEFWEVYDGVEGNVSANMIEFTITSIKYITVEEYRNRVGDEEE